MRLLLAHEGDGIARELAAALGPGTHVVTPRQLSRRGWVHHPLGGGEDTVSIDGEVVPARAIDTVITRLAAVAPADLPHIVEEDREYVACEMTAFLLSFLTGLSCPLINRPSGGSLMGPSWTAVRWRAAAVQAGFQSYREGGAGEPLTIVGERCFGARTERTALAARALARIAQVELLGLAVVEGDAAPLLVGIDPWCLPPPDAVEALRAMGGGPS